MAGDLMKRKRDIDYVRASIAKLESEIPGGHQMIAHLEPIVTKVVALAALRQRLARLVPEPPASPVNVA